MADAMGLLGLAFRKCVTVPDGLFARIRLIINYEKDPLIFTVCNGRNYTVENSSSRTVRLIKAVALLHPVSVRYCIIDISFHYDDFSFCGHMSDGSRH